MASSGSRLRLALVAVAAICGGALTGLQLNLGVLTYETLDLGPDLVGPVFTVVALLALLASPVGVTALGYVWGRRADVRSEYQTFLVVVGAAAVLGFSLAYLPTLAIVSLGSGGLGPSPLVRVLTDLVFALNLVAAPLSGLAGGAIAQFRSPVPGSHATSARRADDVDRDPTVDGTGTDGRPRERSRN